MQHEEQPFPNKDTGSYEEREEHRRQEEQRRRTESAGFTYISTVGWICRRESCRRKDDEFMF
ncbi:MAG: hypothetical protein JEZ12_06355 [Desulfobacterium sp.]|nr:hypothetical protein [Desulfobacterium sp.]